MQRQSNLDVSLFLTLWSLREIKGKEELVLLTKAIRFSYGTKGNNERMHVGMSESEIQVFMNLSIKNMAVNLRVIHQ
jgi:peroxiredoxin family protein